MKLNIREEHQSEFHTIHTLIERAFRGETFSDHTEHNMVDRLRTTDDYIPQLSLVALVDDRIVGHIMMSRAQIVDGQYVVPTLALAPVSVLPEFQGQGIGAALIRAAHCRAAELGYKSVILLGHKDYYPRFGYRPSIIFGIKFPFEVEVEYCQVAELVIDGLQDVHGVAHFAPALLG